MLKKFKQIIDIMKKIKEKSKSAFETDESYKNADDKAWLDHAEKAIIKAMKKLYSIKNLDEMNENEGEEDEKETPADRRARKWLLEIVNRRSESGDEEAKKFLKTFLKKDL